ncbi:MAG: YvcK family protein [Candidatus Firestonebacteria bacterium]
MSKTFKGIRVNIINVEKHINPIRDIITGSTKLVTIDIIAVLLGGAVFILGLRFFLKALNTLYPSKIDIVKASHDELKLLKGSRIVTVGGGTGLSTLLRGLKLYSSNLTAVVTVADDGGSSGKLRKQLKMLPPGDIRSCMVALADSSGLLGRVFQYRFTSKNKNLDEHSFGNLFIAALTSISGSFEKGVQEASKILAIRGKVLPVTLEKVVLEAKLKNNTILKGQSNISHSKHTIDKVFLVPSNPLPSNTALNDIKRAKLIILGPGSLYTSILPNLLIKEIREAIYHSKAKVVYICNIMTQPGETKGYRLSDHINAINHHVGYRDFISYIIANNRYNIPEKTLEKYAQKNSQPVKIDGSNMKKYDAKIISEDLIQISDGLIRHNPEKLAKIILRLTL